MFAMQAIVRNLDFEPDHFGVMHLSDLLGWNWLSARAHSPSRWTLPVVIVTSARKSGVAASQPNITRRNGRNPWVLNRGRDQRRVCRHRGLQYRARHFELDLNGSKDTHRIPTKQFDFQNTDESEVRGLPAITTSAVY